MSALGENGELAIHWALDPAVTFLNHGSFGACPHVVLAEQQKWRTRLERQPLQFLARDLEPLLDQARETVATLIGADADGLAFVPNVTTAVATVLANIHLSPGDEVLTTSHVYPAVRIALQLLAKRTGARLVEAAVPFPISDPSEVENAVLAAVTPNTRLAAVDHITSPTALVFPVETLVPALEARGIDVLVDGAHAPGQVAVDVRALGCAYYVGNCHKWLCAPKGAGFFVVRGDRQAGFLPLVPSHGLASPRTDRSPFRLAHDWTGTDDPSAYLSVPMAIRFLESLLPGGLPALQARNHQLALEAQGILAAVLGIERPAPATMVGSMASVPLSAAIASKPDGPAWLPSAPPAIAEAGIEVPTFFFPAAPSRVLRVTAAAYNHRTQYDKLAALLV